ncbi:MAG: hypothetical protein R3345_00740 [Fulvivirga sp.]|nr:hypothetical protein [Fulvivirga sp.]
MRYLTLCLLIISLQAWSQEIKPRGLFLEDSIKIGQPVGFALSLKYPADLDIVFPDSLFDYSPYELEKKTYVPTRTDGQMNYDSAVYYLTTFEIDTVQYFKLPIFIKHQNDSTLIYTQEDSIILKQLVTEVPDSVSAEAAPLKEKTDYIQVPLAFNYPYFIIGAITLLVLALIIYFLFGEKIKTAFLLRKLNKSHQKFLTQYDKLLKGLDRPNDQLAENILFHWKNYLEKLERRPYTKLTTKEILKKYRSPNKIAEDLKTMDKAIYANIQDHHLKESYHALRSFAEEQFEKKIKEVKNG